MTPLTKYAYHICPTVTAMKIIESGHIDPKFSQGRSKVCWYVSQRQIAWAIAHVCQRRQCEVTDLAIFTVRPDYDTMKRSNKRGIFYCVAKMPILEMTSADIWLSREEQRVFIPGNGRKITRERKQTNK